MAETHLIVVRNAQDQRDIAGFFRSDIEVTSVSESDSLARALNGVAQDMAVIYSDLDWVDEAEVISQIKQRWPGCSTLLIPPLSEPQIALSQLQVPAISAEPNKRSTTYAIGNVLSEMLRMTDDAGDLKSLLGRLTKYIKDQFGFDAVGIRLRDGQDFPYYEARGFDDDFVLAESSLCLMDDDRQLVLDSCGRAELVCLCGSVISGYYDSSKPYFTARGSFWANNAGELAKSAADNEKFRHIRGRCIDIYESLALIPLTAEDERFGLLQLASTQKNAFTPEKMELLEEVGIIVANLVYRKIAEKTLWFTRLTIEKAVEPIVWLDSSARYVYVNEAAVKYSGYSRDQLLSFTAFDIIPGMTQERWNEMWGLMKSSGSISFESTVLRSDGREVPQEVAAIYMVYDEQEYACAIAHDLTERKLAEMALLNANVELRTLVDSCPLAVIAVDADGIVKRWNPAAERIFGWTQEEAIGSFYRPVPDDLKEAFLKELKNILAGDSMVGLHSRRHTKDGQIIDVSISSSAFSGPDGEPYGVLAIVEDITEHKLVENALRQSNERLVALSRQLVDVQEAERRSIARELHDEIGANLTALSIAIEVSTHQSGEEAAKRISEAKELTAEIMRRVQDISLNIRSTMLDDIGLVPALIRYFNNYQSQTGVRISFIHNNCQRRFMLDLETCVFRVIQEGLTNIARHAKVKEAVVNLSAVDGTMGLEISDNGCGFDAAAALNSPIACGLIGMQERVAIMDGEFEIESSPGQGTRIRVSVPIRER